MKHRVNQIENRTNDTHFKNDNGNWRYKNPAQQIFEGMQPSLSVDAMIVHRNKYQQAEAYKQ
ncbi:MAG: hypothetical protein K6F33_04390 [Bacteroidales bacterium]|nr:hypothetical protein [Bacteroidales bacterium]